MRFGRVSPLHTGEDAMFGVDWRSPKVIAAACTTLVALLVIGVIGVRLSAPGPAHPEAGASSSPLGPATPKPKPKPSGNKTNRAEVPPGRSTPQALAPNALITDGAQLAAAAPLDGIHQDQGSSITLPGGRSLWIFADTFQLYREPKFFITSSAAVSNPGSTRLTYAVTGQGKPTEFLPRTAAERADQKDGDHYQAVWPTGSTLLPDGRIIIAYAKYRVLVKQQDFEFLGSGLFEYRYRDLGALLDGGTATRLAPDLWGVDDGLIRSPIYADGYVYFTQCLEVRCYPVRSTPGKLTDRTSYRWWTGYDWSKDSSQAQQVSPLGVQPGANASVVRLRSGGYAMADTEIGAVSATGQLWVAPSPVGPWSASASFTFPRCPPPGCYGLNIHPDQSSKYRVRVSYATNGVGPFVRLYDVPVLISADLSTILTNENPAGGTPTSAALAR
jgi:hypothetical protein